MIRRRDAIVTLGVGTVIAPLSGCLDFAGLRPDGADDDQDPDTAKEPTEDRSGDDRDDEQQADDFDSDHEDDSDDDVDEDPDADGSEDDDDGPPDPGEVQQRDAGEDVLEFGGLQIIDYTEEIDKLEGDEYADGQIRYTGEVRNIGDEMYGSVTVEVRVYDEDGEELDSHRDLTPEIAAGETWRFEIMPHSRPEEIDDHDIAVFVE